MKLRGWSWSFSAAVAIACAPAAPPESPAVDIEGTNIEGPRGEDPGEAVERPPVMAEDAPAKAPPETEPPVLECRLPAPKLSDDPCTTDADCAVDAPCHAKGCVAKAKGNPPKPDTICTFEIVCDSVDANRCGCYQGRCALIPPEAD